MYLIIGMARTGQGAKKFLTNKNISWIGYDDVYQGDNVLNNIEQLPWRSITKAIVSPGIFNWKYIPKILVECRKRGIPIFSDMDVLYHFNSEKKFIGITGSQGKTTIHAFLTNLMMDQKESVASGGNNGIPCLCLDEKEGYILEAAVQQLFINQSILYNIGIFNNFFDTHQEMGNYSFRLNNKAKILNRGENLNQRFIIGMFPLDFEKNIQYLITHEDIKIYSYNYHDISLINEKNYCYIYQNNGSHWVKFCIDDKNDEWEFPNGLGFKLIAEENLAVTVAFAVIMGYKYGDFLRVLTHYQLVDHRLSPIVNHNIPNNIKWLNGSKCTNTFALISLIKYINHFYQGNNYWIMGGIINSPLDPLNKISSNDVIFTYGRDGLILYNYLKNLNYKVFNYENMDQCLENITAMINNQNNGINIVLAPVSQSFDQFKDFEDRGKYFTHWINNYYENKY